MDDIEILVSETFRHFHENYKPAGALLINDEPYAELPDGPGLIYHLQKSPSIFVIRTLVTNSIREDYALIMASPENYPSLRLIEENGEELGEKLRFFSVDSSCEAEIIHDQLNNRRFPVYEEILCNLSDPGFSWWLTKFDDRFQLAFNISTQMDQSTVKLGPLGDQQLAARNFSVLSGFLQNSGIEYSIQNEGSRILFGEENSFLQEEFQNIFEFGQVSDNLKNVFKILARKFPDSSQIETCWLYLAEVAAVRRFWIQIQYDLTN